jgi:hypothetical protein
MGRSRKYFSSGDSWGTELFLVFFLGFVLATGLWLGIWFVHARPIQADSLQSCVAEKQELASLRAKVETEKQLADRQLEEVNAKLEDALAGWGRCIKSQNRIDNQEKPVESTQSSVELEPVAARQ